MRKISIILLLFVGLNLQAQYNQWWDACIKGNDWPQKMALSYYSINSHSTFTKAEKDTIRTILSSPWVVQTFGPGGQNKQICDFFLIFWNSNTTTSHATMTNTKTGNTLWWWYDRNKSYDKWNTTNPVDTCKNGWAACFSTDGFANFTRIGIYNGGWINHLPSLQYFTNLTAIFTASNNFNEPFPQENIKSSLTYIQINNCAHTGAAPNLSTCTNITSILFDINNFTGSTSELSSTVCTIYRMPGNNLTLNNQSIFAKGMTQHHIYNNSLPTSEIDELLLNMDNWYSGTNLMTANCVISLAGSNMGIPTGGVNNVHILSLLSKASSQGVSWTINIRTI
jgi:hypothetical protein